MPHLRHHKTVLKDAHAAIVLLGPCHRHVVPLSIVSQEAGSKGAVPRCHAAGLLWVWIEVQILRIG